MRGRLKKSVLAFVGLAVLLVLLEGLCRWWFPLPPVAEALGPKAPGTFRILAVGGSTVRGLHVPELGFVAQLEALLRTLRPEAELEVENYGRGGRASTVVRAVIEETIERDEPDLYVVLVGHNEFLFRTGSGGLRESIGNALGRSALFRTGTKALAKLRGPPDPKRDSEYVLPKTLVPYDRASDWFGERRAIYFANLRAIVELARAHGVPLVLCTVPANLSDWPPVHEAIAWALDNPSYDADVERIEGLLAGGEAEAALREVERVVAAFGEDAMMSWLAGKALAALGRSAEARAELLRAVDLDPYPWRVLSEFNAAIRAFAAEEGVLLVDVERAFVEHSTDGLVGFDLVSDNCHPTPLGSAVAAGAIARRMAEDGLFLARAARIPDAEEWLDAFLARLEGEGRLFALRGRFLLENAIYCMKTPFRNYSAANVYFAAGVALAPEDWRTWANHGTLALLEGDRDVGIERLRRAGELRGTPLDPDAAQDLELVPYLKEAMIRAEVEGAVLHAGGG